MTRRVRFRNIAIAGLAGAAAVVPQAAQAGGFYLQEQSVRAVGRAFSGEVADSGPQSLWWNPAAIGGMQGCEAATGATVIIPRGKVTDTGTTITRPTGNPLMPTITTPVGGDGQIKNPINKGLLPSGAVACGINDRIAVGVAITSPFSFTTNYPSDSWTRYSADRSHLRTIDIQPSIAVTLTEGLSVGAAANIEQVNAELTRALPQASPLIPTDGRQSLKGSGWDVGWTVGIRYANAMFELGASYKSAIEHTLDGRIVQSGLVGPLAAANIDQKADASFTTPWQAVFGARAHVTPQLTLNLQATRFGWSEFDAIRIGAPINSALEQNYVDTWAFAGGVDYQLSPQTTLRAGVMHDEAPVKDGNRDARVPDTDRWTVAVGASHDLSERLSLDAGLGYTMFKDGPIDRRDQPYGAAFPATLNTSGTFTDGSALLLSVGARARF